MNEIKISDRLAIFQILYPEAHWDTIIDSDIDVESTLDEFGIPKYRTSFIYTIGPEKELKTEVDSFIKEYFNKIYK